MKHAQGKIDPSLINTLKEAYNQDASSFAEGCNDTFDFKTCRRSDGTTYGTSGNCSQKGAKEVMAEANAHGKALNDARNASVGDIQAYQQGILNERELVKELKSKFARGRASLSDMARTLQSGVDSGAVPGVIYKGMIEENKGNLEQIGRNLNKAANAFGLNPGNLSIVVPKLNAYSPSKNDEGPRPNNGSKSKKMTAQDWKDFAALMGTLNAMGAFSQPVNQAPGRGYDPQGDYQNRARVPMSMPKSSAKVYSNSSRRPTSPGNWKRDGDGRWFK